MGEPVPVSNGGIAPSGAEPRDIAAAQFAQRLAGLILTNLPGPLLKLAIGRMRQERPPRKRRTSVTVTTDSPEGVPVTWLAPERVNNGAVVYLPGGLYVAGPVATQWNWLGEIQRRTSLATALISYRKPPDYPHPAALNDAVTAIRTLHRRGELIDGRWILAGDSAGGHLAIAACQHLRDTHGPLPAGLLLTAPLVDMEMANPDTAEAIKADPTSTDSTFWWGFKLYAGNTPLSDPTLSPINAPVDRLPPVHLNIGTRDFFLYDVRRMRDKLRSAGVDVTYIEQQDAKHTYPLRMHTPEAQWTISDQVHWIQRLVAPHQNQPSV
jgi:acetyl esterase/lipase